MNNNKLTKDEQAQVGIGTMIVFIATILVAAVAAGVLIDTSQKLQDKSTRTGSDAINNVGTSLEILSVHGLRTGGAGNLEELQIQVRLAAGAETVSLSALKINYLTAGGLKTVSHGTPATDVVFTAESLGGTAVTTLSAGEVAVLQIGTIGGTGVGLSEATGVSLDFLPQVGHSVSIDFTTPTTYGTNNVFELF